MSKRTVAWLIWSAVVLQVMLNLLRIVLEVSASLTSSEPAYRFMSEVLGSMTVLGFPVIGALIFARRPEHPIGWLFCTVNLGWSVNNFAGTYARYALVYNPGSLPLGELMVWFYGWPGFISVGLTFLLVMLFPNGNLLSHRWRPVMRLIIGTAILGAVTTAFAPGQVDDTIGFEIDNPAGIGGPVGVVLRVISTVSFLLTVPLFVAAVISLILRFRRAQGQERQQLKWVTSAFVLVVILITILFALNVHYGSFAAMPIWAQIFNAMVVLSDVLIAIAAGVAILRYRLYDIDVLINRTLVYGALTAMLVLVYFANVVLLQRVFVRLTGEQSQLAIVASTLAIAALFNPLRRHIQAFIDRRFYRRKYDAAQVLAAFSATARDEVDLDKLTTELVTVVEETLQPAHVSIWLREPEREVKQ